MTAMYYFRGGGGCEMQPTNTHSRGKTRAAGSVWTPSAAAIKVTAQWTTTHRDTSGSSVNSECEIIAAVHGPFYQPSSSLSIYLSLLRSFQPSSTVYRPLVNHHLSATLRCRFFEESWRKNVRRAGKIIAPPRRRRTWLRGYNEI